MKSSPGSARKGAAGRITKECEPGIKWTIPDELMTPTHNAEPAASPSTQTKAPEGPRTFTLWERVQISFASLLGYFAVLVIGPSLDRKSTRLNSSHPSISYAVFCLK